MYLVVKAQYVSISNFLSNGSRKKKLIDRKINESEKKKEGREKGIEGQKEENHTQMGPNVNN